MSIPRWMEPPALAGKTIASIEPVVIKHSNPRERREDPADAEQSKFEADGWLMSFTDGTRVYLVASYDDSSVHFEEPA